MDQCSSTLENDIGANDRVLDTHYDHFPSFLPIHVDDDNNDVDNSEYVISSPVTTYNFRHTDGGEGSIYVGDSPCIASLQEIKNFGKI